MYPEDAKVAKAANRLIWDISNGFFNHLDWGKAVGRKISPDQTVQVRVAVVVHAKELTYPLMV